MKRNTYSKMVKLWNIQLYNSLHRRKNIYTIAPITSPGYEASQITPWPSRFPQFLQNNLALPALYATNYPAFALNGVIILAALMTINYSIFLSSYSPVSRQSCIWASPGRRFMLFFHLWSLVPNWTHTVESYCRFLTTLSLSKVR